MIAADNWDELSISTFVVQKAKYTKPGFPRKYIHKFIAEFQEDVCAVEWLNQD